MKTLLDGSQAASNSEAWRHECEASTLLSWPLAKRKSYLLAVEGKPHRGVLERVRLQDTMMALWIKRHAEKLAELSDNGRQQRLQALANDNRPHIMERIEAQLMAIMEGRAAKAANDNQTERAAL